VVTRDPISGPLVVKLGGRALEGPDATGELARALARLERGAVVVHGGGAEVSAWAQRLGLVPRFAKGRRVTDPATLEVVVAVLAGLANKRLVAALRAHGLDAVGLAAVDGGLVEAVPHREAGSLGAVGTVARVDPSLLVTLLAQGRTPVVASVAAHAGGLLNVNADDLAAALAPALGSAALLLLSDTPHLVLDGATVTNLSLTGLERALAHPDVRDGMGPKLEAARAALVGGVPLVHLARWEGPDTLAALLQGGAPGTSIAPVEGEISHV